MHSCEVEGADPFCLEAEAAIRANAVAIDKGNVGVSTAHHQRIFAVDKPVVKTVQPACAKHRPSTSPAIEGWNRDNRVPAPVQEPELRSLSA